MAIREREFLGGGKEHTVFRSQHAGLVLKRPRFGTVMSIFLIGLGYQAIQNEFEEAKKLTEGTDIQIPRTRIFPIGRGYIIAQEFVDETCQFNKRDVLESLGDSFISKRLMADPHNFRCQDNTIYWLDPGKGPIARILDHWGILRYRNLTIAKATFRKLLGKV